MMPETFWLPYAQLWEPYCGPRGSLMCPCPCGSHISMVPISSWEPCLSSSPTFLWEPPPYCAHVLMGALSSCPTFLWEPCPRGAHILMVPVSSWCPRPCGFPILVGLILTCPHLHAHVLMEPISSRALQTKSRLFGAGADCPHRAKMSPREVALQTEDAASLQRPCWVLGQPRGWREEEEEGSACPCLAHLATASCTQSRADPLQGLQEGRGNSNGILLHPSTAMEGRMDTWAQIS